MTAPTPHLSTRDQAPVLNLGSSRLLHHLPSTHTQGDYAAVEFVSAPGEGVGRHIHENEEELVYLVQGQIEVELGDDKLIAEAGTCALLPRGIPHGYRNIGDTESRLLAILLPGRLDGFFSSLSRELAENRPHEEVITQLCGQYGLRFAA